MMRFLQLEALSYLEAEWKIVFSKNDRGERKGVSFSLC